MKVSRKTKAAREAIADIDYAHKLKGADAQWLEVFMQATVNNDIDAMAILVDQDPAKLARLQRQVYAEDHARRRDVTYVGQRVDVDGDMDGPNLVTFMAGEMPDDAPVHRCRRCMLRNCKCGPRFNIEVKQYDHNDYIPKDFNEDAAISELELTKRMEAFDLLPYGDSPTGLEQGHAVKVCLPHHLLDKAVGYVLMFRPVSGEYLVRSMSKAGLRDKNGVRPKATLLYIKPSGLKRIRPEIVKAFSPSSDTVLKRSK